MPFYICGAHKRVVNIWKLINEKKTFDSLYEKAGTISVLVGGGGGGDPMFIVVYG
jgi:hypothetical protein